MREIEELARECGDPDLRAAADAAKAADEGAYLRVLGPGGLSPREVSYQGMADPARVLADLEAYRRAFAFRPIAEDPPDHVALEVGFVGYLSLKEALALAEGGEEPATIVAEARLRFIETHLRPMAGPLLRRLTAASAPSWLEAAARALVARTGDAPDQRMPLPDDGDAPIPDCPGSSAPV
jgi:hypothetical protein